MGEGESQTLFNAAAIHPDRACILNYVWINKSPDKPRRESEPLCTVPLHDFDKAIANAQRYPDAEVLLWVDFALLDDMSRFFVQGFQASAPKNFKICDLNEITDSNGVKTYRNNNVFKPESGTSIACRADLARVLVVDHCFNQPNVIDVFYSDLDVDDTKLHDPKSLSRLAEYGILVGQESKGDFENGYMVFRRGRGLEFLHDHLLPASLADAAKGLDGFGALLNEMAAWGQREGLIPSQTVDRYAIHILPNMGYRSNTASVYKDSGITAGRSSL